MSNRVQVPMIGSKIRLSEPWVFRLFPEQRNIKLWQAIFGDVNDQWTFHWSMMSSGMWRAASFPAGTVLSVDRIYLRKGLGEYNSLTFRVVSSSDKRIVKQRFWAKLGDVNRIVGEWDEKTFEQEDMVEETFVWEMQRYATQNMPPDIQALFHRRYDDPPCKHRAFFTLDGETFVTDEDMNIIWMEHDGMSDSIPDDRSLWHQRIEE